MTPQFTPRTNNLYVVLIAEWEGRFGQKSLVSDLIRHFHLHFQAFGTGRDLMSQCCWIGCQFASWTRTRGTKEQHLKVVPFPARLVTPKAHPQFDPIFTMGLCVLLGRTAFLSCRSGMDFKLKHGTAGLGLSVVAIWLWAMGQCQPTNKWVGERHLGDANSWGTRVLTHSHTRLSSSWKIHMVLNLFDFVRGPPTGRVFFAQREGVFFAMSKCVLKIPVF